MHRFGLFGTLVGFVESFADPSFGVGEDCPDVVFVGWFVVEWCNAARRSVMEVGDGWEEGGGWCQEEEMEGQLHCSMFGNEIANAGPMKCRRISVILLIITSR